MGLASSKYIAARKQPNNSGEDDSKKSPDESGALNKLRKEAKEKGATLATNGEGGLPSSQVLGVMRRDGYKCKRCGKKENLSIHHKGHLLNPASKWLVKKATSNDSNNLVTICEECHDAIHKDDRKK